MATTGWSLQEAKNKFSAVVDAALAGEPQLVTRHGRVAVVVIAAEAFERINRLDRIQALSFSEMLLTMPQDDGSFYRPDVRPRDLEF